MVPSKLRGSDDNFQNYNFWAQLCIPAPLEVQDSRGEICGVPQPFRASTLHVKTATIAFCQENKNAKLESLTVPIDLLALHFFSSSPKFLNVRQVAEKSRRDHVTFLSRTV